MSRNGTRFAAAGWVVMCIAIITLALELLNIDGAGARGLLAVVIVLLFSIILLVTGLIADREP